MNFVFDVLNETGLTDQVSYLLKRVVDKSVLDKFSTQLGKIQSALKDLKVKDHKIAEDQFDNAINKFAHKMSEFSALSPTNLKRHRWD